MLINTIWFEGRNAEFSSFYLTKPGDNEAQISRVNESYLEALETFENASQTLRFVNMRKNNEI